MDSDIIIGGCTAVDDSIVVDTIIISHKGFFSSLICCFDSTGTAKWIREGISKITASVSDIAHDKHGNIYQTGYFKNSIIFGTDTLTSQLNHHELFFVKYNWQGKLQWVRKTESGHAEGLDISTNKIGNVSIVGIFGGLAHFGDFQVQSISDDDMFLTSYDSLGVCLGVYNYGHGYGTGICEDKDGNLYFTLLFNTATSLGSKSFTSYGSTDIIVAKCSAITGVEEPETTAQKQLVIYDNPTTGKCTIIIPGEFVSGKKFTLQIFDALGRLVQQETVAGGGGAISLDLRSRPAGMYHAILGNGKKSYGGKIILSIPN